MREYPWRLKLIHDGRRFIRVERKGRFFGFDPDAAFHEVGLILGQSEDRIRGVLRTADNGGGEVVVAASLEEQVGTLGGLLVHTWPTEVDGVSFESMEYPCLTQPDRDSGVLRMRQAFKAPRKTARRLMETGRSQSDERAMIVQLTLPDGGRLLHLDLCLHQDIDPEWIQEAQRRFFGADWVICGVEYGQDAVVLEHLKGFGGKINLLTDLVNDERSEQGLPTNLLTPTVDALIDQDIKVYPFPPLSSFRFES